MTGSARHPRLIALALLSASIASSRGGALASSPPAGPLTLVPDPPAPPRLLELWREATDRLRRAADASLGVEARLRLLTETGERLESLGAEPPGPEGGGRLSAPMRAELRRAAAELRAMTKPPFPLDPHLKLLERVGVRLRGEPPLGLSFQGSYAQTKVAEPAVGGHASAMGPPPIPAPASEDAGPPSPVQFVEVPGLSTKTYCGGKTKDHILESGGSGVALFDYDGDGKLDVYLVTAAELDEKRERIPHRNALYRNLGNWKFEDVSKQAGVDAAAWGNGVCAGDFDDDGKLDLYVTNWGPNFLFRNDGKGASRKWRRRPGCKRRAGAPAAPSSTPTATETSISTWLATSRPPGTTSGRRSEPSPGGAAPRPWSGPSACPERPTSSSRTGATGPSRRPPTPHGLKDAAKAYGFGVLATDYDDDGAVDLFVANDTIPNFLYHNRGDGTFESVGLLSGVAVNAEGRAQAGMGVDSGDADGDGRLDLVLTTFAHDTKSLYRNLDGTQFEDASTSSGLAARTFERMGWGAAFFDADLDGGLDLFLANGHIYPERRRVPRPQGDLPPEEPAPLGRAREVPRRLRVGGPGPGRAESRPWAGRGRPRRRR